MRGIMKYIVKGIMPIEYEELQVTVRGNQRFPMFGTCDPPNADKHLERRTPYFETLDMAVRAWAYAVAAHMTEVRIYEVAECGAVVALPCYVSLLQELYSKNGETPPS